MTHDDELRRRMNRLADEADLGTVTLESVQARGRQRTQRQRIFAVAAAFIFVAGAAFTLQTLTDRQGDTDVAAPSDDTDASTADEGDDGDADRDGGAEAPEADGDDAVTTTLAPDTAFTESAAFEMGMDHGHYGHTSQVVPWKDGFLAWGQRHVPSDATITDLVPDLADRLPAEVIDALRAAGIEEGDPFTIDQVMMILEEAELYGLAEETFMADPELLDAFNEIMAGGTYEPFVELSTDGVTWTPVATDILSGDNGWPQVSSNGDALVVTIHNSTWDHETGRTIDQSITVHTTTDLETWNSHELDIDFEPSSPYATVDAYPSSVAAGPEGWYVSVTVHSWVDVYAALPAAVVQEMEESGWGYEIRGEGIALVSYPDHDDFGEPEDDWTEEQWMEWEMSWEPTVERLIPWNELPFGHADVHGPGEGGSYGFVGDYAGAIADAGTPPVDSVECCQVTATDAGFLTLVWDYPEYEPEYDYDSEFGYPTVLPPVYPTIAPGDDTGVLEPVYQGPTVTLWFSTDGVTWVERSVPDSQWYDSLVAVQDGVLLLGSDDEGQTIWRGSADGTGWESGNGPDLGGHRYLWFPSSGPDGVASVIDIAEYDYVEFVAYDVEFAVDGVDLSLSVSETGEQRLVVSEGGTVVAERTGRLYEDDVWVYGENGLEVRDDDGNVIVEVDWETAETIYEAENQAWQAREQNDPYIPEYVLIATVDGRTWFTQDLPSAPDVWYEVAAISNGIVTVRAAGEWTTYPIG